MTIHLPKDVEQSIQAAVHSGHFASADDAVAAAWRSYRRRQTKRAQAGAQAVTPEELNRKLLADGLIASLPDPARDVEDDEPIVIEGEPLSETIIRERR